MTTLTITTTDPLLQVFLALIPGVTALAAAYVGHWLGSKSEKDKRKAEDQRYLKELRIEAYADLIELLSKQLELRRRTRNGFAPTKYLEELHQVQNAVKKSAARVLSYGSDAIKTELGSIYPYLTHDSDQAEDDRNKIIATMIQELQALNATPTGISSVESTDID